MKKNPLHPPQSSAVCNGSTVVLKGSLSNILRLNFEIISSVAIDDQASKNHEECRSLQT